MATSTGPAKVAKPKRKWYIKRLGTRTEFVECVACSMNDGTFRSFAKIVHRGADNKIDRTKTKRGVTQAHNTWDDAQKAADKLVAEFQKNGWTMKVGGGGGGAVKDSFDFSSLPKPSKAAAAPAAPAKK